MGLVGGPVAKASAKFGSSVPVDGTLMENGFLA